MKKRGKNKRVKNYIAAKSIAELAKDLAGYSGSIIKFDSKKGQELLRGRKPSIFLKLLCKAIHRFERKKNKNQEQFDLSRFDENEMLKAVDEVTRNHYPTVLGFKILKLAFYMLCVTANACEYLHNQNPFAARVNTMLSAAAYRLVFHAKAAISTREVQQNSRSSNRLENSAFISAAISSKDQKSEAMFFDVNLNEDPWIAVNAIIRSQCKSYKREKEKAKTIEEEFRRMVGYLAEFADRCARLANRFYVDNNKMPNTSIKVKSYEIDVINSNKRTSARINELHTAHYLQVGNWGAVANKILLEIEKFETKKPIRQISIGYFENSNDRYETDIKKLAKKWKTIIQLLRTKDMPEEYNTAFILHNHFEIRKDGDQNLLVNLANRETCEDALEQIELKVLDSYINLNV